MKKYLLIGAAIAAMAAPASARDGSAYFGLEIGPMWVMDSEVEDDDGTEFLDINHKLGVDGDIIAGYDFGLFRAEWEGAHKWAKHDDYDLDGLGEVEGDGHSRAWSTMINAMVDFGRDDSFNFYAGAGAGLAWLRQEVEIDDDKGSLRERNFAWQLIAGVRAPVFTHFDLGVKYRYFNGGDISDDALGEDFESEFRSHSLLGSLIYNFGVERVLPPPPPLPPAPMAPPPPATRTCPDGSVVLATEACPAPPPPPPPPPPTPERGD